MSHEDISLNIVLNCEETNSSETKQVHFQSLPTTPLEIKKKIEDDFSIPSCVQTLHYQSMVLKDSDQLQHTHFRSGDTFTVDYPFEGECEMVQNVIKWLKELHELLMHFCQQDISTFIHKIRELLLEGDQEGITKALSLTLFTPWEEKMKQVNHYYFQQEGGLEALMKVYGLLVDNEQLRLAIDVIDEQYCLYMEYHCAWAISNYVQTFALRRQVTKLGGLEMCMKTLLRKKLGRNGNDEVNPESFVKNAILSALSSICSLSELPECQVPIAMRADVIDQILAIACCSDYSIIAPIVSVNMIMCLAQSPGAHPYLVRTEVIEDLLKIRTLREKIVDKRPPEAGPEEKEDPAALKALQCYACSALAQIGLGSPDLYSSIPLHLQQQIVGTMSELLETVPPIEIRRYEEKVTMAWGTFLPFLQFLYKPSTYIDHDIKSEFRSADSLRYKLYINCCNILLHGLENALGREFHLEILIKEGLLDYAVCLPAVLPGECQLRARSLVNELGKHRQLQPPSLCTLAKAHIAKTFCGLQPVMEMNSIGEFLHKYFPRPAMRCCI